MAVQHCALLRSNSVCFTGMLRTLRGNAAPNHPRKHTCGVEPLSMNRKIVGGGPAVAGEPQLGSDAAGLPSFPAEVWRVEFDRAAHFEKA